ncbi:MAG: hypothetical protein H7Y38_03195 [Armatimonadetes bacterium]|nr:hypothetical protein [Armatimonadota bacterium]
MDSSQGRLVKYSGDLRTKGTLMQDTVQQVKEAATRGAAVAKEVAMHGAVVAADGFKSAAQETRREAVSLWANPDERNELIRTGVICLAVLLGVSLLVTLTGWFPVWLRILVIFATLGGLAKFLMSRISDSSDT